MLEDCISGLVTGGLVAGRARTDITGGGSGGQKMVAFSVSQVHQAMARRRSKKGQKEIEFCIRADELLYAGFVCE